MIKMGNKKNGGYNVNSLVMHISVEKVHLKRKRIGKYDEHWIF